MSHRCFIPDTCTETGFRSERKDGDTPGYLNVAHTVQTVRNSSFYFVFAPLYSWEPNICLDIQEENWSLIGSVFLFHSIKDNFPFI